MAPALLAEHREKLQLPLNAIIIGKGSELHPCPFSRWEMEQEQVPHTPGSSGLPQSSLAHLGRREIPVMNTWKQELLSSITTDFRIKQLAQF